MSAANVQTTAGDLIPIADRLRYVQGFRVLLAAVVGLVAFLSSGTAGVDAQGAGLATGGYLALSLLTYAVWLKVRRGGLAIFGLFLILDGVFLAFVSYASGGSGSPLRYAIIVHLIAVALLASYRTGMKLAMWHSLLLLVVYYAQQAEILRPLEDDPAGGIGTPFQQLIMFSAVFWLVAIATASFSAVNERELRRRRYDVEALAALATRLERVSDVPEVATTLLDGIVETFDFERALLLENRDGEVVSLLAARGDTGTAAPIAPPGPESALGHALAQRSTELVSELDPNADPWLCSLIPDARNLLIVPMSADDHSIGALVIEHSLRSGSRIERRVVGMVERFASHGALALHGAWLLEKVRKLAATDGLTGVANRATFESTLRRELARAARGQTDVSLVLCDIDHFKRLNDTYGHQVGDDVLKRVAAGLAEGCRPYDTAARYGGEEFAVILPGASHEDALALAERLRAAAASGGDPAVTMSAGVSSFPLDATDGEALIKAADDALYAAKDGGRNRVTSCRAPAPAA